MSDQPRDDALLALGRALMAGGYRFTTITQASHRRVNARPGNDWARGITDVLGWSRPFRDGALDHATVQLMRAAGILEPHEDGWRCTLRASTIGDLLFFHSAFPTSDDDAVFFGPDTYRFVRALEACLAVPGNEVRRAVDIGCGGGPGALTVARRFPGAEVVGADINERALRLTRINARLAGEGKVVAVNSNLLAGVDGAFDLIISNPPYVQDPDQRTYRHGGGELGAGLSLAIVDAAIERLAPGGALLLYTGVAIVDGADPFRREAGARLDRAGFGWAYEEIDPDIFGSELASAAYASADRLAAVLLRAERPLQ
ncbi:methyltransferase [Massilia soli]|uniref:Class I SAM-dependent methyltransferase n=1 Tax=Massilia soli TaxID=2792854 RepID=A0ABS7SUY0_9BURK|nr:class I SAM-dependent methyltransferase [Massilia soli]MBZ2209756.1 class I SAM-dependent methyltransferase [Massilia soli]